MVMMVTMMLLMMLMTILMIILMMTMMMMTIPPSKHFAVLDDIIFTLSRHIQVRPTFAWKFLLFFYPYPSYYHLIFFILIILSSYRHVYKNKLSHHIQVRPTLAWNLISFLSLSYYHLLILSFLSFAYYHLIIMFTKANSAATYK